MVPNGPRSRHELDAKATVGKTKEAEEANGSITVPEVAHDTEEDEYVVCSLLCPARPPVVRS